MATAWAIGSGVGLAALAGTRPFIPLAVFILFARLGWIWGFAVQDAPMDFLLSNIAIVCLLALAVVEILAAKVPVLARTNLWVRLPVAVVVGALLLSAAVSGQLRQFGYLVLLPVGALLALLGVYVHQGLIMAGDGTDPGPALDFSVLALSTAMMLVPPAGYLFGVVALWLAARVRRLRKMKYKGLRVLA